MHGQSFKDNVTMAKNFPTIGECTKYEGRQKVIYHSGTQRIKRFEHLKKCTTKSGEVFIGEYTTTHNVQGGITNHFLRIVKKSKDGKIEEVFHRGQRAKEDTDFLHQPTKQEGKEYYARKPGDPTFEEIAAFNNILPAHIHQARRLKKLADDQQILADEMVAVKKMIQNQIDIAILDGIAIVDPTPISDALSCKKSLADGDKAGAALSCGAMVPGMDGPLKPLKILHNVARLSKLRKKYKKFKKKYCEAACKIKKAKAITNKASQGLSSIPGQGTQ